MKKHILSILTLLVLTTPAAAQADAHAYSMSLVDSLIYEFARQEEDQLNEENYMARYMDHVDKTYDLLRQQYLTHTVLGYFRYPGCHDMKPTVDLFLQRITIDSLRQQVLDAYGKFYEDYSPLFPGNPAPDFTIIDQKGRQHKLSSLRGKMLFIDIWGTWCVPCKEEVPHIQALYDKYKGDRRVMILSIACDKKFDTWKDYITRHQEPWAQYIVNEESNKLLDDVYHVYGIPRFMLIDKKGNIIDADFLRPSFGEQFDKKFEEILNQQ